MAAASTVEVVVVTADGGTVAEEAFYNAISRLNTINTIFDGIAGISFTSYVTLLEFTIAAGQAEVVTGIFEIYLKIALKGSGYVTYFHSNMDFFGYSWDNK